MSFTADAQSYADTLRAAGFTVYADPDAKRPASWFHYSRTVDGETLYGTYNDGSESFDGPSHSMPITPSRLNGSSASIGARWGDADALNLDNIPTESVEYARIVTRRTNWCPWNYPVTAENVAIANRGGSPSRRAQTGAYLPNAKPWGIGTTYHPIG